MMRMVIFVLAFMTTTSIFAQGVIGFQDPTIPDYRYARNEIKIKTEVPNPGGFDHNSPNEVIAASVAISGSVAAILRQLEELSKPPPPVIILPEASGTIIVREMEPVVTHPLPYTFIPIPFTSHP